MYKNIDELLTTECGVRELLSFGHGCCLYGLDSAEVSITELGGTGPRPIMEADIDFGSQAAASEYIGRVAATKFGDAYLIKSGGQEHRPAVFPLGAATRYVSIRDN